MASVATDSDAGGTGARLRTLVLGRRQLDRLLDLDLPKGTELLTLAIGDDTQEALLVESASSLTVGQLRTVHRARESGSNVPLVVAAVADGRVRLLGPDSEAEPTDPLEVEHAARIVNAMLGEGSASAARRRLATLIKALSQSNELPGVDNSGLFATHYLEAGVRAELGWDQAVVHAGPLLSKRGEGLISGLGFTTEALGDGAKLLTPKHGTARAVAVLIGESEQFDAGSQRFGSSPVQYGLSRATQQRVPWLVILRGSQARLYSVRPDVGVGRRSQAETYFELDLAVVDDRTAGFLTLVFSAEALEEGGTVDAIVAGSTRYATRLGERLRKRVYEDVVPKLAVSVARELERIDPDKSLDDAYRITLKILFRLLFQAYAEDQGLLPYGRNDRYTRNSLTTLAGDLLADPDQAFSAESHAIWDDLQQVWGVIDTGNEAWGVPAYNGGLFGIDPDRHPDGYLISQMKLADSYVGNSLRYLLLDETQDGGIGPVDFRSLSVREFGTIYEGLLESSLSRAEQDLTVDRNGAYLPASGDAQVIVDAGQVYHHNASGERKATGSYFTPKFAVEHLLERALDPTLGAHLEGVAGLLDEGKAAEAAALFFDFRVGDLAMGSGHFLVAAVDRIESQMAAFLVDHSIPRVQEEFNRLEQAARKALGASADDHVIEHATLLRRQIARRCIYGVDINEIAVELARVAIWIHTFVPGLPMSTLDHNLVCANSLTGIGTVDEALLALEPDHKAGMAGLLRSEIEKELAQARTLLVDAANSLEATKAEVLDAGEMYRQALERAERARLMLDAAVAVRVGLIDATEEFLGANDLVERAKRPDVREGVGGLAVGHFPALFPEVMERPNGGFDVVLGNPPWEKLVVADWRWWAVRSPGLMGMPARQRSQRIETLVADRPDLARAFEEEVESVRSQREALLAGPFPGMGRGDPDLYKAFAWRFLQLVRQGGSVGVVLPRNAVASAGTLEWRRSVLSGGSFTDVVFLANSGGWVFEEVHQQFTVALVVVRTGRQDPIRFGGPFFSPAEFYAGRDNPTVVPVEEFGDWSDELLFPRVPDHRAGEIMRRMKRHPRFDSDERFDFRPVTELHMTGDRNLFDTDLSRTDLDLDVFTGASFDLWNPDAGDQYARADAAAVEAHLVAKAQSGVSQQNSAFLGLTLKLPEDHPLHRARIAFRAISNSTNQRTAIFCLVPPERALVHSAPYLLRRKGSEADEAFLLGIASSIPFDWYARRWVEMNVSYYLLNPIPVPRPADDHPWRRAAVALAGRLAAVDERFLNWARAVGVKVGQLKDPVAKADAIAELDALSALLYGLEWPDVEHIFETFHRGWDYSDRIAAVERHYRAWEGKA